MSWEIEEIGEDSKSEVIVSNNKDGGGINDVYVAVGKNDMHVLQWALNHAISPGIRVCLVHVFPPISYIPSPGNFYLPILVSEFVSYIGK